jgi:hypothetical protein
MQNRELILTDQTKGVIIYIIFLQEPIFFAIVIIFVSHIHVIYFTHIFLPLNYKIP